MPYNELRRFWGHFWASDGCCEPGRIDLGVDLGRRDVGVPSATWTSRRSPVALYSRVANVCLSVWGVMRLQIPAS